MRVRARELPWPRGQVSLSLGSAGLWAASVRLFGMQRAPGEGLTHARPPFHPEAGRVTRCGRTPLVCAGSEKLSASVNGGFFLTCGLEECLNAWGRFAVVANGRAGYVVKKTVQEGREGGWASAAISPGQASPG